MKKGILLLGLLASVSLLAPLKAKNQEISSIPSLSVKKQQELDTSLFDFDKTNCTLIEKEKANELGVPEGYRGEVLKIVGTNNVPFNLDFTKSKIPLSDSLHITLRIYAKATASGNYPEIRAKVKANGNWALSGLGDMKSDSGISLSKHTNKWMTITITSNNFIGGASWSKDFSSSTDGSLLGNMSFFYRCPNAGDALYIDEVRVDTLGDAFTNKNSFTYKAIKGTTTLLEKEDLSSLNLKEGYGEEALRLTGNIEATAEFDFSPSKIPLALLKNVAVTVYGTGATSGKKPEFHLMATNYSKRGLSMWPYQCKDGSVFMGDGGRSMSSVMETWYTFNINETTLDYKGFKNLESEANPGYLGAFQVMYRCLSASDSLYFSKLDVELKENDKVGPTITYEGPTSLRVPLHSKVTFDVAAFDEGDNVKTEVKEIWSPEQSFDSEGRIEKKGNFTVSLTSSDYYGNVSKKEISVLVGDEDKEAPQIAIPFSTLKLKTGTKFELDYSKYVRDAYDFNVEATFSENAIDEGNRLLKGEHTLIIVATDSSGNVSKKVITIIVLDDLTESGTIIDEEEQFKDFQALDKFIVEYLKKNEIPTTDSRDTGACLRDYQKAKEAYSKLSDAQKEIFENDGRYSEMYLRLIAWARANGETFENREFKPLAKGLVLQKEEGIARLLPFLALLPLASFSLLYFKKKKKQKSF